MSRTLWRTLNNEGPHRGRHWPPVLHVLAQLLLCPVTNNAVKTLASDMYFNIHGTKKGQRRCCPFASTNDSENLLLALKLLRGSRLFVLQYPIKHFRAFRAARS